MYNPTIQLSSVSGSIWDCDSRTEVGQNEGLELSSNLPPVAPSVERQITYSVVSGPGGYIDKSITYSKLPLEERVKVIVKKGNKVVGQGSVSYE